MTSTNQSIKQAWEASFEEAVARQAFNTAPVEAVVRTVSYYLRDRFTEKQMGDLHFLEMGCGAGPNLIWLAKKGIIVSGVDISPTALGLARHNLIRAGCSERISHLVEGSVTNVSFEDGSFDGIVEACVFQHLSKLDRERAFKEVKRLLKPGGVFVGYMLDVGHTVFKAQRQNQLPDDPGTLMLTEGKSKIYLTNLGVCHFFEKEEIIQGLKGFSVVDPCLTTYYLPVEEARKRGYPEYLQSMWTVYAVK